MSATSGQPSVDTDPHDATPAAHGWSDGDDEWDEWDRRRTSLSLPIVLALFFLLALLLLPLGVLPRDVEHLPLGAHLRALLELGERLLAREQHPGVLLDQLVEVREERVRRLEEVELVVPALLHGKRVEERAPAPRGEERGERAGPGPGGRRDRQREEDAPDGDQQGEAHQEHENKNKKDHHKEKKQNTGSDKASEHHQEKEDDAAKKEDEHKDKKEEHSSKAKDAEESKNKK